MKGILVIIDGMADIPNQQLQGKTPLEDAHTPNMNFLAARGEIGIMDPIKPGFAPESEESILNIFGNDLMFGTRGQLEAIGEGIQLTRGDLAVRANFATIDSPQEGNILDRRTGRTLTSIEAEILAKAVNKIQLPCKFTFKPTILHQAILVFRGGFSDNVLGNDPTYMQGKTNKITRVRKAVSLDDEENSRFTANTLNEFAEKAYNVLNNHPVNEERRKKGLLPANYILFRGAGVDFPKLRQHKNWMSFSYFPLEKGFSIASGMKVFSFDYPKLKNIDSYSVLWDGLRRACNLAANIIKSNHRKFDYAYIHINEPDIAGHDNKPHEKKAMIEYIDNTLVHFLKDFAPMNKIKIIITSNHSTPCGTKDHSADPVPILFYNFSIPKEKEFSENNARSGNLGRFLGKDLLNNFGVNREFSAQ
jgi:2,3-bisphosphoglycerate-independent phosphoglycerate mutase